ncbi:hypothetical protein BH09PAT1_BH09PAT1_1300 [soil metagenome]
MPDQVKPKSTTPASNATPLTSPAPSSSPLPTEEWKQRLINNSEPQTKTAKSPQASRDAVSEKNSPAPLQNNPQNPKQSHTTSTKTPNVNVGSQQSNFKQFDEKAKEIKQRVNVPPQNHAPQSTASVPIQGSSNVVLQNVNVGAQASKFNEFSQKASVIQQKVQNEKKASTSGVPTIASSKAINNPIDATKPKKSSPVKSFLGTAAGLAVIGLGGATHTVAEGLKASRPSNPNPNPSSQQDHRYGHTRWTEIIAAYPDIITKNVLTFDGFKQWLAENPTAKLGDQPLTLKDWLQDDYNAYNILQKEVDTTDHQIHKEKVHEQAKSHEHDEVQYHANHSPLIPDTETLSENDPNVEIKDEIDSPPEPVSAPLPHIENTSDPASQPPRHSTPLPTRTPPRSILPGRQRKKGSEPGNIALNALNAIPQVRAINLVRKNKKVIIGIIIGIFLLIVILINILGGGDATTTINKQTLDTSVTPPPEQCTSNPQDCTDKANQASAKNGSTSLLNERETIADTGKSTVLGSATRKDVLGLSWSGYLNLKEIQDRIAKSTITYSITAAYSGQADDIKVTDSIPDNGLFIKASGICHIIQQGDQYSKVTSVWWSVKENQGVDQSQFSNCRTVSIPVNGPTATPTPESTTGVRGISTQKIDITKYQGAPFYLPAPKGSAEPFSTNAMTNANTLGSAIGAIQPYLLTKLSAEKADPFLAVMWTMAIEGSGADPYFWNCNETSKGKANISKGCRGWYNSGNWQVGYGIQVAQAGSHLVDDFNAIYGSGDAAKVQEVGNKVLQGGGITNPATMPAKSIEQLVQEAGSPGTIHVYRPTSDTEAAAQQAIAVLLMDPKIGAASIAQEVAADVGNNWAESMRGWHQDYYTKGLDPSNPTFSNKIKQLAEQYTGISSGISTSTPIGNATFAPITFQDKILPLVKDELFTSDEAVIEVIGGRGGGTASGSASSPGSSTGGAGSTSGAGCTKVSDPSGSDWAKVNSRDQLIVQKVLEVQQNDGASKGTCMPVNLVKALIYEESSGEMLPVNGAGYGGIMQVGVGSNCDHNKYDIYTVEGNVGCGISHLTRGYVECGSWEGTITAYYAGHCTPNGAADDPNLGGSGETDFQYRDRIIGRWHQIDAGAN